MSSGNLVDLVKYLGAWSSRCLKGMLFLKGKDDLLNSFNLIKITLDVYIREVLRLIEISRKMKDLLLKGRN